MLTVAPVVRLVSMAYWSTAESIMRRSFRIRLACERLRARRNEGTAIAASNAMIATTIMISTRVKPFRYENVIFISGNYSYSTQHADYVDHRYNLAADLAPLP